MNTIAIADSRARARFPKRFRSARMHFEFESGPEKMTPNEFWDFCTENDLRAELTKGGEVIIVPPTGFESGDINSELNFQLRGWAKQDKTGNVADSNAGFLLPNGAVYSPDASWTLSTRVNEFSEEKRRKFLPLCPDFVLELRSPSDTLSELTDKMNEYLENGARLGWLIDPQTKQFHVYRPNREPEILQNPVRVSGEDVLVGFELDLNEIW